MAGEETLVEVSLVALGEATELRLAHSRLPSQGSRDAHARGWLSSFDCLEEHLSQTGR
jgi:hypothetical protein